MLSGYRQTAAPKDLHYPRWSTWLQGGAAALQSPRIYRMETIDIFLRRHRLEQTPRIHMRRQRQLDEDSVNLIARVQIRDERQHLAGGDALGRRQHLAPDAQLRARLHLAAHVDLGCRNMADQYHCQSWCNAARRQSPHLGSDLRLDLRGNIHTIQNSRRILHLDSHGTARRRTNPSIQALLHVGPPDLVPWRDVFPPGETGLAASPRVSLVARLSGFPPIPRAGRRICALKWLLPPISHR